MDFLYEDTDIYRNEIAELYSYTEYNEFQENFCAFKIEMELSKQPPIWRVLDNKSQRNFMLKLIDQLDVSNRAARMQAASSILYLLQGCWGEACSVEEQEQFTLSNVKSLYDLGAFASFIELLNMELSSCKMTELKANNVNGELHVTMEKSKGMRLILNVLYVIVETIRCENEKGNPDFKRTFEALEYELANPLSDEVLLPIKLLEMCVEYGSGKGVHFPVKKVLLLLWKSSLVALGGSVTLKNLKNKQRIAAGLNAIIDDTVSASKQMRPSLIPNETVPLTKKQQSKLSRCRDDNISLVAEGPTTTATATNFIRTNAFSPSKRDAAALPFTPKVRRDEISRFLQDARQKFLGFTVANDDQTVIGLPAPIQQSIEAMRRHLYVSLGEVQIEEEALLMAKPLTMKKTDLELTPAELLYQALLPNFRKYMIELIRLLVAASPISKMHAGNINAHIINEIIPKDPTNSDILWQTLKVDISRHKEIIVKACGAIMLLYLKHFRINHIYQFEHMSQELVDANFIQLTLKLFAPQLNEYIESRNAVRTCEFPVCLLPEGKTDVNAVELGYSWRNMFASINLLRILHKLCKWKPSRTLIVISMKATPILRKILSVPQPLLQIYVLKMLKTQLRYLGRTWRRTNLKIMTAIYAKVRHRFNDDWTYGNDSLENILENHDEERRLRLNVVRFNWNRYAELMPHCAECDGKSDDDDSEIPWNKHGLVFNNSKFQQDLDLQNFIVPTAVDESVCEPLKDDGNVDDVELHDDFKKNYMIWLEEQVYKNQFDWDSI